MKLRFASKNADEIYNYLPRGPGVAAHRPAWEGSILFCSLIFGQYL